MIKVKRVASEFFKHEASGGIVLLVAAILALILANSPLSHIYDGLLETPVVFKIGALGLDKTLIHWINDGLMAIFFFLVGLEIKRELLQGELSSVRQASLPALAAIGGMAVPALIYTWINAGDPHALRGWAIPTATDIAFAVGVLALLGDRVPASLKVFLLALAIIDDLGAIIIIAVFYTDNLSVMALMLAAIGIAGLIVLNLRGVMRTAPYVLLGTFVWLCVLKSGVHATLAGVVTALAIPLTPAPHLSHDDEEVSLASHLEHGLHPWVAFAVLPLFAFANAGVSLSGVSADRLLEPIPSGIALGLVFGKAIGVSLMTALGIWLGLKRPEGAKWSQILGVALLAGIGFTMSLFIGMLAFPEPDYAADIRMGVLLGSVVSAIAGYVLLRSVSGARV